MEENIVVQNPLGTEPVGKLMRKFAIPSIISFVVNSLYNMVDQIFIGQGVGYLGNAATNVIMPIVTIMISLSLLLGDGTAAFMSLNLGKKEPEAAAKGVGNMVVLSVIVGVISLIMFEIFLEPVCRLFGATDTVLPYAMDYGRIIVLGFPFFVICSSFGSIIRADGRPKVSMIGLVLGCITNIILDPIFVLVFNWGVKGAAWATIIGQIINAAFFLGCLLRFKTIKLKKEHFIPKSRIMGRTLGLGLSSFITQFAGVIVMALMNNLLVKYGELSVYGGDIPLATFGIAMKVNQLVLGVTLGIATGVQPIIGFNYGSRQFSRVKKTFLSSLLISTIIMTASLLAFQFIPEFILGIFGQESDPRYIEFGVKCFRIFLCGCFMIPANAVVGIFFQAVDRPMPSAVLSLSRQVLILIPAMLVLSAALGIDGMLWSGGVSDILAGTISLITVKAYWHKIFPAEEKLPEPDMPIAEE